MATLNIRGSGATPLTNQQVDDNFQNLNNALGASGSTTIPTPTGTGSPVLNTSPTIASPTISTNLFGGSQANTTRFPYAFSSISSVTGTQVNETTTYIGLLAESKGSGSYNGVGLYGVGYSTGSLRGTGVQGEGHVTATTDTASAVGIRGYATDTHSSGLNVGLYGDASGSSVGNYALYMNSGDIGSTTSQSWVLGGNLTFTGAYTVTIPTLSVTTISGAHNGTVGATTPNTGAFTTLSASSTISGTGFSNYLASPPSIGGTIAAAGAFTTLSASSTVTLSGGTANGVLYLNGSKQIASGSALIFDGANLGMGTSPSARLHVVIPSSYTTATGSLITRDFNGIAGSGETVFEALATDTGYGATGIKVGQKNGGSITSNSSRALAVIANNTEVFAINTLGGATLNGTLNVGNLTTGVGVADTIPSYIEIGQSRQGNGEAYIDFHSSAGSDWDARIIKNGSSNGSLAIYPSSSASNGVYMSYNANSWSAVSDETQKDIIEPISDGLNKVSQLRAVIGKYKTDDDSTRRSFLIAQDVQKVLPEAVSIQNSETGILGLSYTDVIPLLVAAITDLKTELDDLKSKINK